MGSYTAQKREERLELHYRAGFDAAFELLSTELGSTRVKLADDGRVVWVPDAEELAALKDQMSQLLEFLDTADREVAFEAARQFLLQSLGRLV